MSDFPFWESALGGVVALIIFVTVYCCFCVEDGDKECWDCYVACFKGIWKGLQYLVACLAAGIILILTFIPLCIYHKTCGKSDQDEDYRTERSGGDTYEPQLASFYHYTTKANFDNIKASQIIYPSDKDCLMGDGVYFTQVPPSTSSEDIVRNNYSDYSNNPPLNIVTSKLSLSLSLSLPCIVKG